ncbi:MAG: DUF4293 domain-containing protein [Saprospiraceae bacterium]|nr:DUF4293 domain-containing protein [Saprospiraceae bacterium]MDW8230684.1 DUF4293 domain-containing protein [Saprospiraceae bacterium]
MIQRIQTLWLLAAVAAVAATFVLPFMQAPDGDPARAVTALADGALTPTDNTGLLGLSALGALTALAAIFLFKNRPLQGRLALAGAGIGVLLLGLAILAVNMAKAEMPQGANATLSPGVVLPGLYGIFCWLAARAIRRDEALVRSMDRLR